MLKPKRVIIFILFLLLNQISLGQSVFDYVKGTISFKNATNVYVKFPSTDFINIGDTLFLFDGKNYLPLLKVTAKSSISCVAIPLTTKEIMLDAAIYSRKINLQTPIKTENKEDVKLENKVIPPKRDAVIKLPKNENDQDINGRITTGFNTNISNLNDTRNTNAFGRLMLNLDHINNSKWTFNSYINYRKTFTNAELPAGYKTAFFRIYDLSLTYNPTKNLSVSMGRKVSNRLVSIGAVDGIQTEYKLKKIFIGGILGSRPDLINYGMNSSLFQVGAYVGFNTSRATNYSETILGVIEQTNSFQTDRRYLYLQHTNRLTEKVSMFGSMEMDLFQKKNGIKTNSARISSIYYSLTYQLSKKMSIISSYDARRNIIYYETFLLNEIDRLLADDVNRQGLRFRLNYRINKSLTTGMSFSNRFQNDGANNSNNYNGYLMYYNLPLISGNINIDANYNSSNYLDSKIYSFRYSKDFYQQKINVSTYYRIIDYKYINEGIPTDLQKDFGADFSLVPGKNYMFHVMAELSTRGTEKYYRTNFSVTKRIR